MDSKAESMPGADRDDDGKYTDAYPDSAFVRALRSLGSAGTTTVADEVGCDRRTAYLRLKELEDDGQVESRTVGNALLWRLRTDE